jgi:cation:H+ antiporter
VVEILITGLIANVLIIAVSFLVLNWASNLTIHNAVKVSTVTQLGKTTVGFSMLAFSSSLPELTVAIIAASSGGAPISVGNVLGSNIANVCVIVGLAAVILYFKHPRKSTGRNGSSVIPSFAKEELSSVYFGLLVSSVIPLALIYVAQATWVIGLVLISVFVVYTYQLMRVRIPSENAETVAVDERNRLKHYVILTVLGALGVVVSAYFLVESAVAIAQSAGIPETVIGSTIIAFGTSLPELTLGLKAFLKGHPALALGDIIGSSFVNITLILGITLFLPVLLGAPFVMKMVVYQNLVIFSIITNLFFWYFLSQAKLSWREGALFLFIYILFLTTTLGLI